MYLVSGRNFWIIWTNGLSFSRTIHFSSFYLKFKMYTSTFQSTYTINLQQFCIYTYYPIKEIEKVK